MNLRKSLTKHHSSIFMVFRFVHTQKRRVQFLNRFEKGETLVIVFMVFGFLHSQRRWMQLLIRFGTGETLSICSSWFFVFCIPKGYGCNVSSALRGGKLSRILFFMFSVFDITKSDGRKF